MQKDNFNDILQERAKEFTVKPLHTNFESIVIEQQKKQFKIKTRILVGMMVLLVSAVILLKLQFTQTDIPYEEEPGSSNATSAVAPLPGTTNQVHLSPKNSISATGALLPKTAQSSTETIINPANNATVINKPILADKANSNNVIPVNTKNKTRPKLNTNNNSVSMKPEQNGLATVNTRLADAPKINDIVAPAQISDTLQNTNNATINTGNKDTISAIANITSAASSSDSLHNIYKKPKTKDNYSFSIAAFNRYMLVNNAYNGANNSVIKDEYGVDFNEKAKSSITNGVSFHINKKNFSLGIGLAYTNIQFNKIYSTANIYNNQSADSVLENALANKSLAGYKRNVIDQNLKYLEIPISLSYKFGTKPFHFSSQVGASFQWLFSTETYLFESNNSHINFKTIDDANDARFQHIQITYFTSLHANYQVSKWNFFAGPILKLHQNQLFNDDFIKRNPASFIGIESGIKYNF